MGNKLLIRSYNVELGDCIYCRIPGAKKVAGGTDDFHMLIDCGSLGSGGLLDAAIEHLGNELPRTAQGRKRLDLLVVTHEHKDHMAGFNPELFEDFKIENLWMSTAMDKEHPQAGKAFALQAFAAAEMQRFAMQGLALGPELQGLVDSFSLDNKDIMKALRTTLPNKNGIEAHYVHAGLNARDLGLRLVDTQIHVLGPERDIDGFYVGKEADESLRGLRSSTARFRQEGDVATKSEPPPNISAADFRRLQARMLSNAFAFTHKANKIINNTSIVLLIEWKGKRLLFVGDAEWQDNFDEERQNGSWNVMWHLHKSNLDAPIDFLKIGHHGSINATPWNDKEDGRQTEPSTILDAILPVRPAGVSKKARALVSTKRGNMYPSIPSSALLMELGKRIANTRRYDGEFDRNGIKPKDIPHFKEREEDWLAEPQPVRTDFEFLLAESNFVEVEIEA
jgi:hypothetical protein